MIIIKLQTTLNRKCPVKTRWCFFVKQSYFSVLRVHAELDTPASDLRGCILILLLT